MTPLLLVTGFLGAGKTTFLRALIPALGALGLRPRVVLNDFQDARIDAATLADLTVDLVALSGSCVCCENLDDLLVILGNLEGRPGDVVIVEANGGTEAGELLALLGSEPALDRLAPPLQLAVVDAQRFGTRGWQDQMEHEQLQTATHLFLSRTEVVSAERGASVTAALAAIAPKATCVTPATMARTLADAEATLRPLPTRAAFSTSRRSAALRLVPSPNPVAHAHAPHFASHLVTLPAPVDADAFVAFLRNLPAEVLRAKGIVLLRDPAGAKRSFQKVERDVEISPCELAEPELLDPRAVFVGPALPIAAIEDGIAALMTTLPAAPAVPPANATQRP
ncbi:MAG TPA: GTP-binding protein [Polyangia bacterium]